MTNTGKGVPGESKAAAATSSAVARFEAQCGAGLFSARARLESLLAADGPRTADSLLEPYNQIEIEVERTAAMASLMRSVNPDRAIREAAESCEQEAASFVTDLRLNRDLYEAFLAIDTEALDDDARRLVEHTLRDYRRAGVDKDEATRARLKEIDEKLVVLGQEFSKNIVDDVRHIELDSVDDLAGLPSDYIEAHRPASGQKIRITTNYPDYIPFMSYADDTELRRQLYIASRSRGGAENEAVLKQILALRAEKARTLGYDNWADYATEDKMMKSAASVRAFIDRVAQTARERADRDYQELLAWKREHLEPGAEVVHDYEKSYVENKVKSERYSFNAQEVRPYFEFERVQRGLLDITSEIYEITYRDAANADLWHEDVRAFDVMQDDERIGRIYLDMHPREGKYQHAAQFTLRSGVLGVQVPEGVLVCNFPSPRTSSGPALLEHDDVVTMFHEFGHLMHHILGGQQHWIDHSGVATEWDFVEVPSQMFEEWAWQHETLSRFATHCESDAVIPADMVLRMRRADKFGVGVQTVQQMFYASISLGFHTADPDALDMAGEVRALQQKLTPFPFVDGTRFHANFSHLNGYSALYYTYMWSLVIAKDVLTPFREHGLMNREWTHRFRDAVLAPGGSVDAAELVREFLGREFNFDAFEHYLSDAA